MKKLIIQPTVARKLLSSAGVVFFGTASLLFFAELAGVVISQLFVSEQNQAAALLITITTALFFVLMILGGVLRATGFTWSAVGYTLPRRPWIKKWLFALVLYVLLSSALVAIATAVLPHFNANQAQDVGLSTNHSALLLVLGFVSLVIITPIFEETIFRGLLFRGLKRSIGFYPAAIIASLVFAVAHGQWNVAVDTFALGLFLAYLVEKTDSILPSVLLHAIKNSVAFMILFVLNR